MDSFVGEVRIFGFNFAPVDWALCNGQTIPISQNATLYSIIGTSFGGNGTTTFQLPNLQGSAPLAAGQGPGLTNRYLGESLGERSVTLTFSTIPGHIHALQVFEQTGEANLVAAPGSTIGVSRLVENAHQSGKKNVSSFLSSGNSNATMAVQTMGTAGASAPHENTQPWLAMNFCICLIGVFPTHP
jgi:microcystin-dependent protein